MSSSTTLLVLLMTLTISGSLTSADGGVQQRVTSLEKMAGELLTSNLALREEISMLEQSMKIVDTKQPSLGSVANAIGTGVTVSNPVAFFAGVTPFLRDLTQNEIVRFDHVVTNYGAAYSLISGIFTAPVNGLYYFNMGLMVDSGQSTDLHLSVNGVDLAQMIADSSGLQAASTTSRDVILQLTRGSQVTVRNAFPGPKMVHGNSFTTFSGFLIHSFEENADIDNK